MLTLRAWDRGTDTIIEPERVPVNNEWARFPNDTKKTWYDPKTPDKSITERSWRDSELLLTDSILQVDRPDNQAILTYRVELRDYPSQADFPNGTRPSL